MTANGWLQIVLYFVLILALTKPLGVYMHRAFEGPNRPLPRVFGPIERFLFKLCGVKGDESQTWKGYTVFLLVFSAIGVIVTYLFQRLQHVLPLNPQHLGAVSTALVVQHGGQLHDQHELAGVRGRVDDELPDPDGGAGLAQLHVGGAPASASRWCSPAA